MPDRRLWRHFDYPLLIAIILIVAFGVAMIYSASRGDPEIDRTPTNQAVTALIGLSVLFLATLIDYSLLQNASWLLYGITFLLLAGVLIFGENRLNARRWYNLGGFDFQPGEAAKLMLGVVIATFISQRQGKRPYLETIVISGILVLPCIVFVLLQPNLSTALIITFMWLMMIFAGGIDSRHIGTLMTIFAAVFILIILVTLIADIDIIEPPATQCAPNDQVCIDISNTLKRPAIIRQYQLQRITSFFNPSDREQNYQVDQAFIAFGSGGLLGQGYLQGTQGQLRFLPARHTDFIFSIVGEELGFLGAGVLLLALMFVIYRTLRTAWIAHDMFGRMLCISIASVLFLQTFINLGMQVGIMPVTGVVLPFVSYGRSNLISAIVAIGIVQSIAMRHKKLEF
jgi:rod shape determining protein RodA